MQGKPDSGFGSRAGMADGFMTQPVVQETGPADDFLPEPEVPGWDMAESIFPESSSRTDSMGLFSEETAPTKIYEPKRHKKESGSVFPEPEQAAEKAGNDWMIYG